MAATATFVSDLDINEELESLWPGFKELSSKQKITAMQLAMRAWENNVPPSEQALAVIIESLEHNETLVRETAAVALGKITLTQQGIQLLHTQNVAQILLQGLETPQDRESINIYSYAFGQIAATVSGAILLKDVGAVDELIKGIMNRNSQPRNSGSAQALAQIAESKSGAELLKKANAIGELMTNLRGVCTMSHELLGTMPAIALGYIARTKNGAALLRAEQTVDVLVKNMRERHPQHSSYPNKEIAHISVYAIGQLAASTTGITLIGANELAALITAIKQDTKNITMIWHYAINAIDQISQMRQGADLIAREGIMDSLLADLQDPKIEHKGYAIGILERFAGNSTTAKFFTPKYKEKLEQLGFLTHRNNIKNTLKRSRPDLFEQTPFVRTLQAMDKLERVLGG